MAAVTEPNLMPKRVHSCNGEHVEQLSDKRAASLFEGSAFDSRNVASLMPQQSGNGSACGEFETEFEAEDAESEHVLYSCIFA